MLGNDVNVTMDSPCGDNVAGAGMGMKWGWAQIILPCHSLLHTALLQVI